jgi:hypothetical protein
MACALLDPVDKTRDIFAGMMMVDAAEAHLFMTTGTDNPVAVHNAFHALTKGNAAIRTAHTHLDVVDRVVHGVAPAGAAMMAVR